MYSKFEFELEFITPAFIGGAFNEEEVELRPASLIGSLRYWFRNLLGTITDNVDAIYKLEEELFGSQQKAGAVKVKVKPQSELQNYIKNQLPRGVSYIAYGLQGRPYLDIGSKFQITFLVPKKYEDLFVSFLYIYNFLGSLGGRSRRGWGNFILKPISGLKEEFKNLNWEVFAERDFQQSFILFLNNIKLKSTRSKLWIFAFKFLPLYRILKKNTNKGKLILSLLASLSTQYKRKRQQYKPGKQEEDYIVYNLIWLGLPILGAKVVSSSKGVSFKVNINFGCEKNKKFTKTRLASPVSFRVIKTDINKYSILRLVKIYSEKAIKSFLKNEQSFSTWHIKVKAGYDCSVKAFNSRTESQVVSEYSLENFMSEFFKGWEAK